jgi:NADPH:quinone reductase-like Zn-dependent oxidoreductase
MAGPLSLFTDCVIGTEFAGRRADTGERIFGYCCGRGIATYIDTREDMTSPIPEKWSMEESVTIVSTYCTVWYSLIERARLQRSE